MTTALREDELLIEARLPLLAADTRCGFYEFSRRAGDFAMAAAVGIYRLDAAARSSSRALRRRRRTQSAPHSEAERALAGASTRRQGVPRRGRRRNAAVDAMEDAITSAEFRRDLVLAVTRRALERAAA